MALRGLSARRYPDAGRELACGFLGRHRLVDGSEQLLVFEFDLLELLGFAVSELGLHVPQDEAVIQADETGVYADKEPPVGAPLQ